MQLLGIAKAASGMPGPDKALGEVIRHGYRPGRGRRRTAAVMIMAYLLFAVSLVGTGAAVGFIALVSLGIHREEEAQSMTGPTPDRIARGARVANGFHTRDSGMAPAEDDRDPLLLAGQR